MALAVAASARRGDEGALRRLLGFLRVKARAGEPHAVAAMLAAGHALDHLEGRAHWPEAHHALQLALRLPPGAAGPALVALNTTLTRPDTRWLDLVEAGLLRRLRVAAAEVRGEDLRLVDAMCDMLPPARLRAHLDGWVSAWVRDVETWRTRLWRELAP
jgi:hypothetical protein